MNPENAYFSTRIREEMRLSGLTISQFAEHVGVSMPAVQNWRNGVIPNAYRLRKIARLCQCSMESFFNDAPLRLPNERPEAIQAISLARQLVRLLTSERKTQSKPRPK